MLKTSISSRKVLSDYEYDEVIFANALSKNIPEVYFTNFLKNSGDGKKKSTLKEIKETIVTCKKNIDSLFSGTELQYSALSGERLLTILNEYGYHFTERDIKNIHKYKHYQEAGIQLYAVVENNKINVIAIDVHHLIIPSEYIFHKGGKRPSRPKELYRSIKDNDFCISNLLLDVEKELEEVL